VQWWVFANLCATFCGIYITPDEGSSPALLVGTWNPTSGSHLPADGGGQDLSLLEVSYLPFRTLFAVNKVAAYAERRRLQHGGAIGGMAFRTWTNYLHRAPHHIYDKEFLIPREWVI